MGTGSAVGEVVMMVGWGPEWTGAGGSIDTGMETSIGTFTFQITAGFEYNMTVS